MNYRQGDVLIQKINKVSGSLKQDKGDIIVALGEVTGHAHKFKTENGNVELYEEEGTLYIKVISEAALLTHEEHDTLTLPRGDYMIRIQREYEPQGWREVVD